MLQLSAAMDSVPSGYFQYYYFEEEILADYHAKATTRAEDILAEVPSYWSHYREQAESPDPQLDPSRSRGGIHELELAIDCMDAVFNDRDEVMTVNVANATWTNAIGDAELVGLWKDPEFDAAQPAFYYLRVIEIPTPCWTAYDAAHYGVAPPAESPMTQQERAYTSPIWYSPP